MRASNLLIGVVVCAVASGSALAPQPTIGDLMRKIDALQHRVDELESQQKAVKTQVARTHREAAAAAAAARPPPPAALAPAAAPSAPAAMAKAEPTPPPFETTVPGLIPPEPMGNQFSNEDALRSDLPGLSIRIPGTDSQVHLYGFAKLRALTI